MIKLTLEDFIFEVKDEILSYDELGSQKANEWETNFLKWVEDQKLKKNKSGQVICFIKDESEIFDIADEFYYANEQNYVEKYWNDFSQEIMFK